MLAVGRALMSRPKLIMMDEPSLGLAPIIVKEIFKIIQEINKRGVTILLIEQNANMALNIADLAYVLETGTIALREKNLWQMKKLKNCTSEKAVNNIKPRNYCFGVIFSFLYFILRLKSSY